MALGAQLALGAPAMAETHGLTQAAAVDKSIPVTPVASHYTKPVPESSAKLPAPAWPTGSAVVALDAGTGIQAAGALPIGVSVPRSATAAKAAPGKGAASAAVSKASVTLEPKSLATSLGANGVVFAVARADGARAAGSVRVSLSYRQFEDAFGGDWAARLALVTLPACALTTPALATCRTEQPLAFSNDSKTGTLDATVTLPAVVGNTAQPLVLAATSNSSSDAGSGGGDYTATTLKSNSGSWSAGGGSDPFTWSYPFAVPTVPGGLVPSLTASYDSQSVDGLTSATNNQAGVIGDGWDLSDSYIERSYSSCHQNPTGSTQTYDTCWSADNQLTIDLNGQTSALIKDDSSGKYHPAADANESIQYKTGAVNGAQSGEYWVVTTTDGTQYYFGLNQLPGYVSGDAATNSVDTEPVYSTVNTPGACYNATFSSSYCSQAYRWNLDYVVDTHGDAISYWYTKSTNYYAQDKGTSAPSTSAYTRDSVLSEIQYGQRAGAVYSSTPAGEVALTYNGRCNTSPTGCATSTLTTSTASTWPDVPFDLNCASGATCSSQSPTFWSEDELTGIKTEALVGSTLTPVDSWALTYALPAITGAGDTSTPSLWLSTIAQTGLDTSAGGSTSSIPLPAVTFTGTPLQNRVNLTNGYPWITRQRLTKIVTETGEKITVDYSAPACGGATPSSDSANTMLCYPVYWYPTNTTNPSKDYFNKYIVQEVTEDDTTGGSSADAIQTTYTPVGNPAWHYSGNPLTPANQRTWDQFRGYSGMIVSTGTAPDPVTKTQYSYFQGMDGDYLTSTSTRTVTVSDTRGDAPIADLNQYAGTAYETQVFNGTALVSDSIENPWTSAATATHALSGGLPAQQAFLTGLAEERVYTPLASGSIRETETDYTHDSYGRVTAVNALGDVTVAAQHTCTTTSYADNTTAWILDKPAEVKTVSVPCTTTATFPADAVSDSLTFYDNSTTLGAAPTIGDGTKVEKAVTYSGSTPNYVTSSAAYDEYGRVTSATDADTRTTATAYTPATGAEPTSIAVTDPLGQLTTTAYDPLRNLPTTITTAAGYITTAQYDAVGRLTAVYRPGFSAAAKVPNLKYTYSVSSTAPSVTDTYTLNDDQSYRVTETIYDSMLRAREVQTGTVDGNRDIVDTYYNTDGWVSEVTGSYYNAAPVGTTYVQAQPGAVPAETGFTYDGAGRKTAAIVYALGTQTWQTTYTYGGDFTTTVPPAGGTPTTTVTDALGRKTDLIEYLAGEPTDYVNDPATDYTDTKYGYYPSGKQASETDTAGDQWSWKYDLLGNQTDTYDPDTGHSTTAYDNVGQVLTTTDARGKQTTYTYDKDGRKSAEYDTTTTQTLSSANEVDSWAYDTVKKGFPTSSTSYSNGDTYTVATLAYNGMGLPEATKYTLTGTDAALVPAAGYTVSYGYTFTGLPSVVSDPAMGGTGGLPAETITTSYDNYAHPIKLAGSGGVSWTYVSAVSYDHYDHPTLYTMPTASGQVQAGLSYDPQTSALTGIETTDSTNANPVDQLTYTYGNASGSVSKGSGLLTATIDSQSGGSIVDTQCFSYDYAQRLSQAWTATDNCAATPSSGNSATVGGTDAPYWQSWTYDAAGDRTGQVDHDTSGNTANDTATTYNYPALGSSSDQATSLTSTTATGPNASANTAAYSYNAAGQETGVTGGALGNQGYTWNDQDQLQSTTSSAGVTNYVYDASGTQIVMRDPGSTTVTMGDVQLNQVTGSGSVTGTRYYKLGSTTVAERTSAGVVSDLVPDRQGTDQLAINTDAAQTITRRQYLPFGGTRGTDVTWVGGDKGYVGGQADPSTGLETLGARVYDPVDGRFLSADPLFEANDPTQLGGYDYAGNDPVTGEDPTGERECVDGCGSADDESVQAATDEQEGKTAAAAAAKKRWRYLMYNGYTNAHRTAQALLLGYLWENYGYDSSISIDYETYVPGGGEGGGPGHADVTMVTPDENADGTTSGYIEYVWEVKHAGGDAEKVDGPNDLNRYITTENKLFRETGEDMRAEAGFDIPGVLGPVPVAGSPGQRLIAYSSKQKKNSGVFVYDVQNSDGEKEKPSPQDSPISIEDIINTTASFTLLEVMRGAAAAWSAASTGTLDAEVTTAEASEATLGATGVAGEVVEAGMDAAGDAALVAAG